MGMALGSSLPLSGAELEDLYEIVEGQKVWPRAGERETPALYEVVNGQRKEVPRMGALAATIASFLVSHLNFFAWQHKLGFAVTEVLLQLRPGSPQRRPDLAFIRYERWTVPPQPAEDPPAWPVVPNLAVEIVSPNNLAEEIEEKLEEYFQAGVEQVWVIYPLRRRVYAYESLTQARILTENDELDGGTMLPGFRLSIATLFSTLVKPS